MKNLISILSIVIFLSSCQPQAFIKDADALWKIVSQSCLPNQTTHNDPAPCAEVSLLSAEQGYAVLKDRVGPLQFLLMPTTKVTGIESPLILTKDSPHYFYEAWNAKSHMVKKFNATIPDEEVSLAINSQIGRSQNQLHIHISCIKPEIKNLLQKNSDSITDTWTTFPSKIEDHTYYWRLIDFQNLKANNPFKLLSDDFVDAKDHMGEFGLALAVIKGKNGQQQFALLADKADPNINDYGHAEEIQDHECPQLFKPSSLSK